MMSYSPGQYYRLSYAVAIALAIHMVILFWLALNTASKAPTTPQMEVTLSYHNSDKAPEDADFIAHSNRLLSRELLRLKVMRNAALHWQNQY